MKTSDLQNFTKDFRLLPFSIIYCFYVKKTSCCYQLIFLQWFEKHASITRLNQLQVPLMKELGIVIVQR